MTPSPDYRRLWFTGFSAGLRALRSARTTKQIRNALRFVLCPVDLWRYYEVAAVLANRPDSATVLSIGSPSVVPVLLSEHSRPVYASDFVLDAAREARSCGNRGAGLVSLQCDALHLPFADHSIPFIVSVSAFEHIGGNGDTEAMREVARVLSVSGTAVITVPLVPKYSERWVDSDPYGNQARNAEGEVFFSRYYDYVTLQDRLLSPSGLRIRAIHAWHECTIGWYADYCQRTAHPESFRSIVTKLLDPFWARNRIEYVHGGPGSVNGNGLVAVVLDNRA